MNEQQIAEILERYKAGQASEEEKALLLSWSLNFKPANTEELSMEDRVLEVDLIWAELAKKLPQAGEVAQVSKVPQAGEAPKGKQVQQGKQLQQTPRANQAPQGKQVQQTPPAPQEKPVRLWSPLLAAAIVTAILSLGTLLYINHLQSSGDQVASEQILPGTNQAVLTLSNGKRIALDSVANEELLTEAGVTVTRTKGGQLVYSAAANNNASSKNQYNVLETFKGQQYQVILPDGSHVWLNAASSLRYPLAFGKQERLVELKGEGYFEVAHNKTKPFRVKTADQQVEVLGTHFNINAYPEDQVSKTTLLEGSVRVMVPALSRQDRGQLILAPGQQSVLVGNQLKVQPADLEVAIAWRNGNFMFEGENIRAIMKKIARWYNVEVVYEGEVPDNEFGGTVSRFSNVSQVLRKLELTGKVHFKIEERRIIVTK